MTAYDLLATGRVAVDLYPLQHGVPLEEVHSFEKFLGGSAAKMRSGRSRADKSLLGGLRPMAREAPET